MFAHGDGAVQTDKLFAESGFLSLGTKAGSFSKLIVANDDFGNLTGVVQCDFHIHGTGKTLGRSKVTAIFILTDNVRFGSFNGSAGSRGSNRCFSFRLGFHRFAAGESQCLIDGLNHSSAGNGGAGNGIHLFAQVNGAAQPNELLIESGFLCLLAVTGGFGKAVVADDDFGDGLLIVHCDFHIHGTGKALDFRIETAGRNFANIGRRGGREAGDLAYFVSRAVHAAHNGIGRDGGRSDGVHIFMQRHGNGKTGELVGESGFFCFGTQTGSFGKVGTAHADAGEYTVRIKTDDDFDIAAKTDNGGSGYIANSFAIFILAFIEGRKRFVFQLIKDAGSGKQFPAGRGSFFQSLRVDGILGHFVSGTQQNCCHQRNEGQDKPSGHTFFVHGQFLRIN